MQLSVGQIVRLKKPHPCGCADWEIKRTGMDFRIQCMKCGHQTWIARMKLEKSIKDIIANDVGQ